MSNEAFIGFLAAAMTAIVTLVAVWLSNRSSEKRLAIQLEHERSSHLDTIIRDRAEELYELSERYFVLLLSRYIPFIKVMEGAFDYNQALDMANEWAENSKVNVHRLELLIDVYFSGLRVALDEVYLKRDTANEIVEVHKARYKTGDFDGQMFVEPLRKASLDINRAAQEFKQKAIRVIRSEAGCH